MADDPATAATVAFRHDLRQAVRREVSGAVAKRTPSNGAHGAGLSADANEPEIGDFLSELLSPAWSRDRVRLEGHLSAVCTSVELRVAFLQAAARRLGEAWSADQASFSDVTLGVSRLQVLSRCVAAAPSTTAAHADASRSILLTAPIGEQHHLAMHLIRQLMTARGWHTTVMVPDSRAATVECIGTGEFDLICVTWSTGALAEAAALLMDDLTSSECAAPILGGGKAMEAAAGRMEALGVTRISDDIRAAVSIADAEMRAVMSNDLGAADMPMPGARLETDLRT